ncbi:MAG: carbohydrate ABC transporter permease, partial [Eubacteriales bacterium]|nr:carbohydrate ABC transporter permease [Eubacteriales bacterium]
MNRGNVIGGTKARAAQSAQISGMLILFVLYMMPFLLVFVNSFKLKRDIIKAPFALLPDGGLTLENYS